MAINRMCTSLDGIRVALYCKTNAVGVNFIAFAIGSGENLSPENATGLTNEEVRFPVTSVKKVSDGKYRIRGELSNNDFSSDITFRELGIYCEDSEKGGEVLYCYGNAKGVDFDYTETLYCFDSTGVVRSRIFEIDIFLDNNVNPTFIIDNSGKADIVTVNEIIEDVEALREDVERHNQEIESLEQEVGTLGQEVDNLKNSSANVASNAETFTYVVDSDQALEDWANNVEGNDYTSVLIRKGEWTINKGINLTLTNTFRIKGEAGAKLVFNLTVTSDSSNAISYNPTGSGTEKGVAAIYLDIEPSGIEACKYYIKDLEVNLNVSKTATNSTVKNAVAILRYPNIEGCKIITKATLTNHSSGGYIRPFAISVSNNIRYCSAYAECITTYSGTGAGISSSIKVHNCYVEAYIGASVSEATKGVGILSCKNVQMCKCKGGSQSYSDSYASYSKTTEYACADTPSGGFNS